MKNSTCGAVFVLGAGFSRAIGTCAIHSKSFDSPLDKDFFKVLKEQEILSELLSEKPCLTSILSWMNIYDRTTNKLEQEDFSLERFWTQIALMLKLNSSISGFPDFGLPMPADDILIQNGIPNLDSYKNNMSQEEKILYEYLSNTPKGNFFNPEGLLLYLADYELKRLIFDVYSTIKPRDNSKVAEFKEIVGDASIISFNYDCLSDSIFQEHVIFEYDKRVNLENNRLIIKPHGSLGWEVKKKYSVNNNNKGIVEILKRQINREAPKNILNGKVMNGSMEMSFPIILPMCPAKENFVAGLDSKRIEICSDNEDNEKREFIDCVVAYAKMIEVIRSAKRLIFIGYSFPRTDYETIALLNLATKHSDDRECHICVKDGDVSFCDIPCKKSVYYRNGMEEFLEVYKNE